MRKAFKKIFLMLVLLSPLSVLAVGNISVSPASLSIEVGSSKTFTISAYNTVGDASISSSNPGVASVSTGYWSTGAIDELQTKNGSITVTGNSVGTATITLVIDAATFDSEDLSGQVRTVTVNVVAKPTPPPQPVNNNTNTNTNTNTSNKNKTTAKTQKEKEAEKKAEEEAKKAKEEEEARKKEEAEQKEKEAKLRLNKATILVETAEKSLVRDDYDAAVEAVNELDDSSDKEKLLERLEDVKFNVAVKEECKVSPNEKKSNNGVKKWIILSVVLLLTAIIEFIYIIVKQKKDNN